MTVAEQIGQADAGALTPDELLLWAAHLERKREAEDRKWDRRFLGVWVAVARYFAGAYKDRGDLVPSKLFPAAFGGGGGMTKDEVEAWFENRKDST